MMFTNKVVLITGAASGIGAAAAAHFEKFGALVCLVDSDAAALQRTTFKTSGKIVCSDIVAEPSQAIDECVKCFGKLDVLVNNAGVLIPDDLHDFSPAPFDRMMRVNLLAPIMLSKLATPFLAKTKGNIINVGSVAASLPASGPLSYSLSKSALEHFTRCAAISLADKGIRVNAISPGMIRTKILRSIFNENNSAESFFELHKNDALVRRVGDVSDVSAGILYLASASFVTGISLVVDGGMMCVGLPRLD